jgi:hypothetical protein
MRSGTSVEVGAERAAAGKLDIGVKLMDHGLRDERKQCRILKSCDFGLPCSFAASWRVWTSCIPSHKANSIPIEVSSESSLAKLTQNRLLFKIL